MVLKKLPALFGKTFLLNLKRKFDMPHDDKLSRGAGFFADLVTLVFLVVLLLWGEWLLPWVLSIFDR